MDDVASLYETIDSLRSRVDELESECAKWKLRSELSTNTYAAMLDDMDKHSAERDALKLREALAQAVKGLMASTAVIEEVALSIRPNGWMWALGVARDAVELAKEAGIEVPRARSKTEGAK
jgi:hypothetical protein